MGRIYQYDNTMGMRDPVGAVVPEFALEPAREEPTEQPAAECALSPVNVPFQGEQETPEMMEPKATNDENIKQDILRSAERRCSVVKDDTKEDALRLKENIAASTQRECISMTQLAEQCSVPPLGSNLEADGLNKGVPSSVISASASMVPGAYPGGESPNAHTDVMEQSNASLMFGTGSEELEPEDPCGGTGLAQALPVTLPIETAQPLDVREAEARKDQLEKEGTVRVRLVVLGSCVLVLVAIGIIGIVIGLVTNDSNSVSTEVNQTQTQSQDSPGTSAPTAWTWDLPFEIPNTTLHTILLDAHGSSPQSRAYQWIKQDPYRQNYTSQRLLQRFVMVIFYYSTNGEEWVHQGGGNITVTADAISSLEFFSSMGPPAPKGGAGDPPPPMQGGGRHLLRKQRQLQGSPPPPGGDKETIEVTIVSEPWLSYGHSECDWFSRASLQNSTMCGEDGALELIDLMQNNLAGRLPEQLGLLTTLQEIKLGRNEIGSTIPSHLSSLTRLTNLRLHSNQFTGTLPSELGLLSDSLAEFSAKDNALVGTIPIELWQLSKMEQIMLGRTELTGSLPEDIGEHMPSVKLFFVDRAKFSGPIPTSIGLMKDLITLHMDGNSFSGTLPTQLGQLQTVTRLFLRDNQFTGTLPSQLGLLPQLKELKVEGNAGLGGAFPPELENANGTLTHLFLKGTGITGTIPTGLCGIFKIYFDCSATLCGCDCPCQGGNNSRV